MLVVLKNREIAEKWELFKDVLRSSIPKTPDLVPDWLTNCLFSAMCGSLQFWLGYDERLGEDRFYCAFVTKIVADELTGQKAMLIYAMKVFNKATHETRIEDLRTLGRICKVKGIKRITAFCLSKVSYNALKKAFPNLEMTYYCSIPIGEEK